MIWGAVIGAATGLVIYFTRGGGSVWKMQWERMGPGTVISLVIFNAVAYGAIGTLIGWALS